MENSIEPPQWHKSASPIYSVITDCVLDWPDERNCNEFPVVCPAHGTLSAWYLKSNSDQCTCGKNLLHPSEEAESSPHQLRRRAGTSVREILEQLWGDVPCLLRGLNSGTPVDSFENRRVVFNGQQLSFTPRGPVVVDSHSLRALTDCNRRKPQTGAGKSPLGFVYAYLDDLGVVNEWSTVLRSEVRHFVPADVHIREPQKYVLIYRKRHCPGLAVNVMPNVKSFVTYIDYSQFECKPDLHYGDQILELNHCILQRDFSFAACSSQEPDAFRLRIRPCPYLKWLNMTMGLCPLVTEDTSIRSTRDNMRSRLDMGFSIFHGCVTSVAVNSPAQEAGLQPNQHIVEIANIFVANHTDQQIINMIRQHIKDSPTRSVSLVVMPEQIHTQLQSTRNIHHIVINDGFHLDAWVNAVPFGLRD
ncbi:hypothetical protein P879_00958 [Paragonimus westermani]|uniref:PDZ domain-containing protein n=1 Tax=Paragonimus westermani TaxID=34504 RepID=A0A8T0DJU7_9TREM|nr:hypothetical protein P879_00958 [Paragonimus westermani]